MLKTNRHVTWFRGHVSRRDREQLNGHRGLVMWFTGLSASGKSTVAHLVERDLHMRGCSTYVLDGDNVRHGLCSDLGFSTVDRGENIRRIGEMVRLFVDAGLIVLTAFISPFRSDRQKIRALFEGHEFVEVFVDCPVDVCASRDGKGLYEKACSGVIRNFTGVSDPYEPPEHPEITIRSHKETPEEASAKVLAHVKGIIRPVKEMKRMGGVL